MRIMVDTSVLVAAMVEGHPHHAVALPGLQLVQQKSEEGWLQHIRWLNCMLFSPGCRAQSPYPTADGGTPHSDKRPGSMRGCGLI